MCYLRAEDVYRLPDHMQSADRRKELNMLDTDLSMLKHKVRRRALFS